MDTDQTLHPFMVHNLTQIVELRRDSRRPVGATRAHVDPANVRRQIAFLEITGGTPYARWSGRAMVAVRGGWYCESMALSECCFKTDRLVVDDWSRLLTGDAAQELRDSFVVSLLTEAVTRDLPPGWQGPYDTDRAASWFVARQSESTVLLIVGRSDGVPVGLLILSQSENSHEPLDVRLGYMIDESAWGKGLATEVVAGFARWCRTNGTMRSIKGGVSDGNSASARVLHKNGFVPHTKSADRPTDEVEYTLTFNR